MSTKTAAKKKRHRNRQSASRQARPRPVTESRPEARVATKPRKPAPRRRRRFDPSLGQVGIVGAIALVAALFFFGSRGSSGGEVKQPTAAPGFTMASTGGGDVSLSGFSGRPVLLYFNEGLGCDACFYQTLELEKESDAFAQRDITILPIVMNDVDSVRSELERFGISTPYLIDADGSVSKAYGVLGKGMHANLPGHGFVFIDGSGQIRWQKEYDSMYAPASEILAGIDPYLS